MATKTVTAPAEVIARIKGVVVVDARGFRTIYEFVDGGQHLVNEAYEVDEDVPAEDIPDAPCYVVIEHLDVDTYENHCWSDQPIPLRFVAAPDEIEKY